MRILAIADHVDPLVYSPAVKERFKDVDLILGAGDLPLDYYDYVASCLNKPLIFVFGNHNLRHLQFFRGNSDPMHAGGVPQDPRRRLPGGIYVDGKVRRIHGLLVGGLGGSPWYNGGPNQFRDKQVRIRLLRMVPRLFWNRLVHGRAIDILLTHTPPLGVGDAPDRTHRGFGPLLWFLRKFRPLVLVHGHVHLYDRNQVRSRRFEDTWVVNAYDHVVIDTENLGDLEISGGTL